ncbi:hypothetical protein Musp01_27530 [Muricauda sp. NBRC 101325]|nr:hypothetical protein Musp01_27530 [Muricauda sp. NBRC 101325]
MVCVVLFLTIYSIMTFGKDEETELDPERIPIPDLEDNQFEFESKLEALEAIKEERETPAPPMYPDHMVDDKGYFNPDYMEYEKQRIIDSVFQSSNLEEIAPSIKKMEEEMPNQLQSDSLETDMASLDVSNPIFMQERALEHQLFFASRPALDVGLGGLAHVDGNQIVKDGHRLMLRLDTDMYLDGRQLPKGSPIYGFVKIRPNRVLLDIVKIGEYQVKLKAVDLQDGEDGIYVENQLRGEVIESGVDAALGDVNIPGVPQLGGIKHIFQRNNRSIKVAIQHHYQIKVIPVP